MKIYMKSYLMYNLGDDLFFKIMLDRYKKEKFFATALKGYNKYYRGDIKFINSKSKLDKLIKLLTNRKLSLERIYMKKSDITVLLGGSMFMQKNNSKQHLDYFIGEGKPYYILGSNFGPYYTEDYYDRFREIFSKSKDVCFREKHSYNLFKVLPNVRQASDIVFSLDTSNIKITNNKKVIISIINCDKKVKTEYKENYENKIIGIIELLDKKGYEVILMSYCKIEGDEEAIKSILSKIIDEKLKDRVKTYFYNGNIEEALNVMGDCQLVIGSRFHANILGLVLGKTVIPIAYSDKTLNVLKDMNFKGKVFDIRKLQDLDVNSLNDEDLNYKLDITFQKKDAQRHFEILDRTLNGDGK